MLIRAEDATRPGRIHAVLDIATHVQAREAPSVQLTRLHPRGASPMRPPLFLLGDLHAIETSVLFTQLATPDVGCYEIQDAAIAPTGIATKDGVAFSSPAFMLWPHHVETVIGRLNTLHLPRRRVPGPVAIIDAPGHETWGHWLVDFLPRLAVLYDAGWDIGALRFVVPWDLQPFGHELLHLCGIPEDRIVAYNYWHEVIETDRLILPAGLRAGDRFSPYFARATRFWVERLLARLRLPRGPNLPRLFLVRRDIERQITNRDEIELLARRRGLALVRPELMTVAEQIALMRDARIIAGEYGSALHNSVFAGAGAAVCALRGTSAHPAFVQSGLATALDQQVGYVFGDSTGQDVMQRFAIAPAAFEQALSILETL